MERRLLKFLLILFVLIHQAAFSKQLTGNKKYLKGKGITLYLRKNPIYKGANFHYISYVNEDAVNLWFKKKIYLKEGLNFIMVNYAAVANFPGLLLMSWLPDFTGEKTISFQYGADNWNLCKNKVLLRFYAEKDKEYAIDHFLPSRRKPNPDVSGEIVIREVETKKIVSILVKRYPSRAPEDSFFGGAKNFKVAYTDKQYVNDFEEIYKKQIADTSFISKQIDEVNKMQEKYEKIYPLIDSFPKKISEKNVDKAMEFYNAMIDNEIDINHARFRLALLYGFKKDFEKAIEILNIIIESNPDAYWAMYTHANYLSKMNNKDEAKLIIDKANEVNKRVTDEYMSRKVGFKKNTK